MLAPFKNLMSQRPGKAFWESCCKKKKLDPPGVVLGTLPPNSIPQKSVFFYSGANILFFCLKVLEAKMDEVVSLLGDLFLVNTPGKKVFRHRLSFCY